MSDRMSDVARLVGEKAQLNALVEQLSDTARVALELQMAAEAALSSAESRLASLTGQVEHAAREKVVAWMIQHSIATGHGDTLDDLLGELSVALSSAERRIEELGRGLASVAEVLDPHWRATHKPGDAAWMVEEIVALASLTGQVEDMRAALEPFVQHYESWMDEYPDNHESSTFSRHTFGQLRAARAAIRSLPVLPTAGDGGGWDDDVTPEGVQAIREKANAAMKGAVLSPTGRETSGEET